MGEISASSRCIAHTAIVFCFAFMSCPVFTNPMPLVTQIGKEAPCVALDKCPCGGYDFSQKHEGVTKVKERKLVAALHDIVGLGRCSLTMVIPVLSAMGVLTCPVPTAVFSAHTLYPSFEKQSLNDFMRKTLESYVRDDVHFDASYSGYLGDVGQIEIIKAFMDKQKGLRIVDPVFGDHGALYPSISTEMVDGMRDLIASADIIVPNLTEAAFLLRREAVEELPRAQEMDWLNALRDHGPRNVLITSCQRQGETDSVSVLGLDEKGEAFRVCSPLLPAQFHGNGDLFGSVLVGGMVNGLPLREAVRQAAGFVYAAIEETMQAQTPVIEGVRLEASLSLLTTLQAYENITVEPV